MMGFSTAKLIAFGIGLIAVLGFIALALSWKAERNELRDWQAVVVSATQDASANPKLLERDVPQQIRLLGEAVADLKSSVGRQNAAIDQLTKRTQEQQRNASEALQDARTRARAAEGASARLMASSRAERGSEAVCEPSETVKELWR